MSGMPYTSQRLSSTDNYTMHRQKATTTTTAIEPTTTTVEPTTTTTSGPPTTTSIFGEPIVDLGSATGNPCAQVSLPITLTNDGITPVAGVSMDIGYNSTYLTPVSATIGPAGQQAGKNVASNIVSPGLFRVGVFSSSNLSPIGNGIVAYVTFEISCDAPFVTYGLSNTPSAATPEGVDVPTDGSDGSIQVVEESTSTTTIQPTTTTSVITTTIQPTTTTTVITTTIQPTTTTTVITSTTTSVQPTTSIVPTTSVSTTTIPQEADLLVSLGVNKTLVRRGDLLTYTITVQNFGPNTATNVVVNDVLPDSTTFYRAQSNKGRFTTPPQDQNGTVTWYMGDMPANDQQNAQLTVTVIIKGKSMITNIAKVKSDNPDPNEDNNTATIQVTVWSGTSGGGKKK